MIVTGVAAVDGVYETEHDPEESVHETPENLPLPVLDHETAPVGEDPITAAVQIVDAAAFTCEGEHVTELW